MLVATANKILDKIFNGTDFTHPTSLYVALHTADPGGTGANEVSGGSYTRKAIDFTGASGGAIDLNGDVEFQGMPSATLTHVSLWDASSGGTVWWEDALSSQKVVASGDTFRLQTGNYDISLS